MDGTVCTDHTANSKIHPPSQHPQVQRLLTCFANCLRIIRSQTVCSPHWSFSSCSLWPPNDTSGPSAAQGQRPRNKNPFYRGCCVLTRQATGKATNAHTSSCLPRASTARRQPSDRCSSLKQDIKTWRQQSGIIIFYSVLNECRLAQAG